MTAVEHSAEFVPAGEGSTDAFSFAIYPIPAGGFAGNPRITLDWSVEPAAESVLLGLPGDDRSCWEWYVPEGGTVLQLDSLDRYTASDQVLVTVLIHGTAPATLDAIILGDRLTVGGVDVTELWAPALPLEVAAARMDWESRDTTARDFRIEYDEVSRDGRRKVVSYLVDDLRCYAVLDIPQTESPDVRLPLMVYCHPGSGMTMAGIAGTVWNLTRDDELRRKFISVAPAFRGEALSGRDIGEFVCDGPQSIYDREADDVLALIDGILGNIPEASPEPLILVGYSRGAQVALRTAQRNPAVTGVVCFCGVTDYWSPREQMFQYRALTSFEESGVGERSGRHDVAILQDLYSGEADIWAVRRVMMLSSTLYFAGDLPPIQIHHGTDDKSISINESRRLAGVLERLGSDCEFYEYEGGIHALSGMDGAGQRLRDFIASQLEYARVDDL